MVSQTRLGLLASSNINVIQTQLNTRTVNAIITEDKMSSKKINVAKPKRSETLNHYFPVKEKQNFVGNTLTKTLANRLREESQALKDLDKAEEWIEGQTDHTECIEKVNELEKRIMDLEKKNRELLSDCKRLKKMFDDATKINLQKDVKINGILNAGANSHCGEQLMYSNFNGDFTETELKELRSIVISSSTDCKFITTCLRMVYKNDLKVLIHRTAEVPFDGKTPLTPTKKNRINKIYQSRLLYVPSSEYSARLSKLNEHLKNGIRNISRSKMVKNLLQEQL